ncbi:MAG: hypothetical protein QM705_11085 [Ancrocorticia sp.]
MTDLLVAMLQQIMGSAFASGADGLKQSVAGYNADVYNFVQTVNEVAIKPVAMSILGIMLMMELIRITTKFEGAREAALQMVCLSLAKTAVIVVIIQNASLVLEGMNEAAEEMAGKVDALGQDAVAAGLPDSVKTAIDGMSTIDQAGLMMVLFIPWLLCIVGDIALKLIVLVRFAELYILAAAVSLPLIFIANEETKSITFGYLRGYGGVLVQGVVIVIIVAIYSFFQVDTVDLSGVDGDNILSTITNNIDALILGPVFFLVLIFGASKFAKRLMGEG